jgi:hypothetical protein
MKKVIILPVMLITFLSCNKQNEIERLQLHIDSLKQNSYKPGFGEFMSSIQVHHAKLWFAGQNENWQLADYEIHEIKETLEGIQKYQTERKESQMVIMLYPVLDSVNTSIQQKNLGLFKTTFTSLTNTCNNCHKLANYSFNDVKIPDTPPFSNQVFKEENK